VQCRLITNGRRSWILSTLLNFWSTDLELGSEDDPSSVTASAGHATHPVRKRIAIKLRQGGKGRSSSSSKKAKMKSVKDPTSEGGQAGRDNESDTQFGTNSYMYIRVICRICRNCRMNE